MHRLNTMPSKKEQTDFIKAMKAQCYNNGTPRPSPAELKAFIESQVPNTPDTMGGYQWAAMVADVSTRTVRRWLDENDPVQVPFACWVLLRLAGGEHVEVLNPLKEQKLDKH